MVAPSVSRSLVHRVRRVLVWVVTGSFTIAALGGIAVLLGGELGEVAGRVLISTFAVGVFAVATLCCATLLGRPFWFVGVAGSLAALGTMVHSLLLIWASDAIGGELSWRTFVTGLILTAAFALASLLLLYADRQRAAIRVGLWVTLALLALLVGLGLWALWSDDALGEWFWRLFGIVAIAVTLGSVVVPVMSLLLPDTARAVAEGRGQHAVSPELSQRLVTAAQERGVTVEELVAPVLAVPDAPVRPS